MGVFWALLSVIIVTASQLALRHAMVLLPPVSSLQLLAHYLLTGQAGTLALFCGLFGYLLSMVCWFFALRRLPLARAYALMSLSYILVWAAAIALPGWHEAFSWRSLAGVVAIVAGVWVIFRRKAKT
ncbi:4-amino-4-deoxy-L-arabinose-phosphoundecaprenol flippase subunit ArnF [Pseudocitrobacter cyperus]|uniref:Probable 4-amino-4-deoxy-L-arabinose-phosphoundecaprenol flippase subunit ArnF n=1 Tax=Pseudocitrobacter cyperus TaxID=3112843 RepID=A0ABV0HPH2_9ENTR